MDLEKSTLDRLDETRMVLALVDDDKRVIPLVSKFTAWKSGEVRSKLSRLVTVRFKRKFA